jgi:hypothetical protein
MYERSSCITAVLLLISYMHLYYLHVYYLSSCHPPPPVLSPFFLSKVLCVLFKIPVRP